MSLGHISFTGLRPRTICHFMPPPRGLAGHYFFAGNFDATATGRGGANPGGGMEAEAKLGTVVAPTAAAARWARQAAKEDAAGSLASAMAAAGSRANGRRSRGSPMKAVGRLARDRRFYISCRWRCKFAPRGVVLYSSGRRRCFFFASTSSIGEGVLGLEDAKVSYFYIYIIYWTVPASFCD